MIQRKLCLFVIGCCLPCIASHAQGPASGHDWPRLLGPAGDGKSAEAIRTDWPEQGLDVIWFERVGEGFGAPSVAAERLFIFDRIGSSARLRALDAASGKKLWSSRYPTDYEDLYAGSDGPLSSPVVDGERVFVFGVEGRLRAQAADSGEVLWEIDTNQRYGVVPFFFGVGATPLVEGDLLIVPIGGSPADSPSISRGKVVGNGSGVVAFDKRTGEERYRLSDELASYSSPVTATISGRRWGFVFARGGLIGFDPVRGREEFFFPWRASKLATVNAANPVVGDTVFLTETYGPGAVLLRVSPEGAEPIWKDPPRDKSLQSHWSTPIFHDGILYGSSGRATGEAELRAIEHLTGKIRWSEPGLGRSTLLYADGNLLVLTETGRLLLIKASPERFELKGEMDLGERPKATSGKAEKSLETEPADRPILRFPSWNAPVLSHGRLYLRGKDQLICLDVAPDAEPAGD